MQHKPDVLVLPIDQPLKKGITTHTRIMVDHRSVFAMEIIRDIARSGSYGVSVVDAAVTMVEYAFACFEEREWLQELPPISELREDDSQKVGF